MSNAQSNNLLRELNAKLLAEIAELRKKFAEIKVENDELKDKNAKIVAFSDKITKLEAERTKLKTKIEELESENVEFRDRIIKVKQRQLQNDNITKVTNSPNNSSSNFNSITNHCQASGANDAVPEVIIVPANSKLPEEKEMDKFLDEAYKKNVSDRIRKCNKKKKLSKAEQISLNQDQESDTECSTSEKIPKVSNPVTKISAETSLLKNSHRKKDAENISQMISNSIQNDAQSQKLTDAEYVNEVTKGNKIGEKKAKGIIYNKMLEDLSILCKKRSKETDIDKIKYITTYSVNSILELTNNKIKEIIDSFPKQEDELPTPEISARGSCQNLAEVPISITHSSNSLGNSSFMPQITPAEVKNHDDYDEVYYDNKACFNDPTPQSEKETNEVQIVDDSDCNHNNDSKEERLDESNDNRYNGYDRYDKYSECDRGYYYHNRRYERKSSPMMSPIILPVTA
ncbi:15045_t:CDS:2 [Cetraspora pellucida]|uniref:15045_t:CDS:1 n=1 Tax=Cetraspora pellucida TaxID=1433469 RepID=A0ACA9KU40_9GLOM|nr:15045_t:CDS:2 [Cetraspora pellucida]